MLRTSIFGVFGVTETHYLFIAAQLASAYDPGVFDGSVPAAVPLLGDRSVREV